jgi:4-carboxymuconolactone decarboxylase
MARLTSIISKDQVPPQHKSAVESIIKSRGAISGPFTMFLHSPEVAERVAHLGAYIRFEGSLDMRVRVLAAMTVARELDAMYVWGAQTGQARKLKVAEETISAIRENHSRGIPAEDAQIVEFTRALLRKHRVDDGTAKALRERFGDDEFVQLTTAIGYYSLLAMTVNACELEPAAGAEVLPV